MMTATKQRTSRRNRRADAAIATAAFEAGFQAAQEAIGTEEVSEADAIAAVESYALAKAEADRINAEAKPYESEMNRAKKVIKQLKGRRYGKWMLIWKPNTRQWPDMEAIEAVFKEHGLGPVPMKPTADSIVIVEA